MVLGKEDRRITGRVHHTVAYTLLQLRFWGRWGYITALVVDDRNSNSYLLLPHFRALQIFIRLASLYFAGSPIYARGVQVSSAP